MLWRSSKIEEETWEREAKMNEKYPYLFKDEGMILNFQDEFFFKMRECKPRYKFGIKLEKFFILSKKIK